MLKFVVGALFANLGAAWAATRILVGTDVWHLHYGKWWMVQWSLDWWASLGIHVDFKQRKHAVLGVKYGPYVDFHLGFVILSLGYHPQLSGELECSKSCGRGGFR